MPEVTVKRSKVLHASKDRVLELITDMSRFQEYDAWGIAEPSAEYKTSSPAAGVGAWHAWDGKIIGAGKMIIDSIAPDRNRVDLTIEFFKPQKDVGKTSWTLEEFQESGSTYCKATWAITFKLAWYLAFFAKKFAKMLDGMIGSSYEYSLTKIAHILDENEPDIQIIVGASKKLEATHYVGIAFDKKTVSALKGLYEGYFPKIMEFCEKEKLSYRECFTLYNYYNRKTGEMGGVIGTFVDRKIESAEGFNCSTLPAQHYTKIIHKGEYTGLGYAWMTASMYAKPLQDKNHKKLPSLELYTHMAKDRNDANITEILIPVKS